MKYVVLPFTLVIVESPSKCRKIEDFLGGSYKVVATYGHLRELNSLNDIGDNFDCQYKEAMSIAKRKQIRIIRNLIKECDEVILATDDDREGEAIAWHVVDMFNLNLDSTKRIKFNEITKKAILYAINNASRVDMNMVNAQKARQVLDLTIGFKITPLLWKAFSKQYQKSLSAGRCQTPTLRLIYDNEQERNKCDYDQGYETIGYFSTECIPLSLAKSFPSKTCVLEFLENSKTYEHIFNRDNIRDKHKSQPKPLSTSKLQQLASNDLHMSPKETMSTCQKLYENGLITYMRTDCRQYSTEFIDNAKLFILDTYGRDYIRYDIINITKLHNKEAHEAIRPTNIFLSSYDTLDKKEKNMYKLIWCNAVESCMSESVYQTLTARISAYNENQFVGIFDKNIFAGWEMIKGVNDSKVKLFDYVKHIKNNTLIFTHQLHSRERIEKPVQHYTEAKLIQLLESKGIGRPSTYASLVEKIQDRGYAKKQNVPGKLIECTDYFLEKGVITSKNEERIIGNEKNKLVITNLGIITVEYLTANFQNIFDYNYTKEMESNLDALSKGECSLFTICKQCDCLVESLINVTRKEQEKEGQIEVDEFHSYVIGKHGPVIKKVIDDNVTFHRVKRGVNIEQIKKLDYCIEDILDTTTVSKEEKSIGLYESKEVFIKKGRFGLYALWDNQKVSLKVFGNRPKENIKINEVVGYLDCHVFATFRELNESTSIRSGAKGLYIYYKSRVMKKPQFLHLNGFHNDPKTCDLSDLKTWIEDTHGIHVK
tara:strand:- start:875 stop:3178 length:2304 start_codon:yes stop_codon:yes gene_type:complete